MQLSSFLGTRARFQRLTDAKFFSGWVRDLTNGDVRLAVKGEIAVTPGEPFVVQLFGKGQTAILKCKLTMVVGDQLGFIITSPAKIMASTENARTATQGMKAMVTSGDQQIEAAVLDVSATGVGLLMPNSLERGTTIMLQMDSPSGVVAATGEVRYSRQDPNYGDQYRTGIQLKELGRVDQARWNRMFDLDAA